MFSCCSLLRYLGFGEHLSVCTDVIKHTLGVLRSSTAEWQGCTSAFHGNARNEGLGTYPAMRRSSAWGQSLQRVPPQLLRALPAPLLCAACCPHGTSMFSTIKHCWMRFLGVLQLHFTWGRDWKPQIPASTSGYGMRCSE